MPAKLNNKNEKAAAVSGDFLPKPTHLFKSLTSPDESLIKAIIQNAASVANP